MPCFNSKTNGLWVFTHWVLSQRPMNTVMPWWWWHHLFCLWSDSLHGCDSPHQCLALLADNTSLSSDASWISISTRFPHLSQSMCRLSRLLNPSLPNSWSPCLLLCQQPEGCRQWPEVSDFVARWAAMWELHENSMHLLYGSGFFECKTCDINHIPRAHA